VNVLAQNLFTGISLPAVEEKHKKAKTHLEEL